METTPDPEERLVARIAEMAAHGELPISAAFWRRKLREEVMANVVGHAPAIRRHVKRLYEAQLNVKLNLIAMVSEAEAGLAA